MKQYRVLFSPRAEQQLGDLYSYITDRSGEERAEGFISGIVIFCQNLSTFPERGTKRVLIYLSHPNLPVISFYWSLLTIYFDAIFADSWRLEMSFLSLDVRFYSCFPFFSK